MRKYAFVSGLWVVALLGSAAMAGAAGPGEFAPSGSMSTVRNNAAVVKLADGRVLVAGGQDGQSPTPDFLTLAEIYDPATGTFSPTGSMGTGRSDPVAVLLASGKVLISGGGIDTFAATNTSELYDPATGTFTPNASMAVARLGSSSTLLSDGRVFIAGGATGTFNSPVASSTLYNPDGGIDHTGSFTGGTPMLTGRANASAVLLPGDKVLIAGGNSTFLSYFNSAEIWTPTTTNVATGPMSTAHSLAVSALLPSGKVLIAGGTDDSVSVTGVAELYNPGTGTFATTGPLAVPRSYMAGTSLADGRVLVAGGLGNGSEHLVSAEIYDPASGTFGPTGNLPASRWGASAVTLDNGRVLLVGGLDADNKPVATTDLFYPDGLPFDLTVTRSGSGTGSVVSNPAGIDCGTTCSATYGHGDVVSLTATPASKSVFSGWSGACSDTGACEVPIDQAKSVEAKFDLAKPNLTIKVKPGSRTVRRGKKASFKAQVGNTGTGPAAALKVCIEASKSRVKVGRCQGSGSLAPGASKTFTFRLKVNAKAKTGRTGLVFTATGKGTGKKSAGAGLRIRP